MKKSQSVILRKKSKPALPEIKIEDITIKTKKTKKITSDLPQHITDVGPLIKPKSGKRELKRQADEAERKQRWDKFLEILDSAHQNIVISIQNNSDMGSYHEPSFIQYMKLVNAGFTNILPPNNHYIEHQFAIIKKYRTRIAKEKNA